MENQKKEVLKTHLLKLLSDPDVKRIDIKDVVYKTEISKSEIIEALRQLISGQNSN